MKAPRPEAGRLLAVCPCSAACPLPVVCPCSAACPLWVAFRCSAACLLPAAFRCSAVVRQASCRRRRARVIDTQDPKHRMRQETIFVPRPAGVTDYTERGHTSHTEESQPLVGAALDWINDTLRQATQSGSASTTERSNHSRSIGDGLMGS